jgi:hypothetical protein
MIRSIKLWRELNRTRATAARQAPMPEGERHLWVWSYFERRQVTPRWVIWCHELDCMRDRKGWGQLERMAWMALLDEAQGAIKK